MEPTEDTRDLAETDLRELAGFLTDGVALFDANGNLRLVNDRFRKLYPRFRIC